MMSQFPRYISKLELNHTFPRNITPFQENRIPVSVRSPNIPSTYTPYIKHPFRSVLCLLCTLIYRLINNALFDSHSVIFISTLSWSLVWWVGYPAWHTHPPPCPHQRPTHILRFKRFAKIISLVECEVTYNTEIWWTISLKMMQTFPVTLHGISSHFGIFIKK